ncbi:Septin-domain-containing protein [Spinellus fusiger]|nr:Septin-domain-containing protein [Spinellus fusiger]
MTCREKSTYNVLVLGTPGAGKTTFLNTLLHTLEANGSLISSQCPQRQAQFDLFSTTQLHLRDQQGATIVNWIDTPGFEGAILGNQARYTEKYMEHQFNKFWMEQLKAKRNPKALDTRIHACLYFITSTITDLDPAQLFFLRRLARCVSVIPVLGKKDLLSDTQLKETQAILRESFIDHHQLPLYGTEWINTREEDFLSWCVPDEINYIPTWRSLKDYTAWLERVSRGEEDMRRVKDYMDQMPLSVSALCHAESAIRKEDVDADSSNVMSLVHLLFGNRQLFRDRTHSYYYEKYRTQKLFDEHWKLAVMPERQDTLDTFDTHEIV